jgi:hypothetical protein
MAVAAAAAATAPVLLALVAQGGLVGTAAALMVSAALAVPAVRLMV